jgi:dCMP deaminase
MMDQFKDLVDKYKQLEYHLEEDMPFNRPSFDEMYMAIAEIVSLRSTCLRGKIGAVIVKDTRIVSIGYNGAPAKLGQCDEFGCIKDTDRGGCIRTIHAEQNAIAYAARVGIPLEGSTLYVTMSPCIDCAKLIIATGIKKVIYKEKYRKGYAVDYLEVSGIDMIHLETGIEEVYRKYKE